MTWKYHDERCVTWVRRTCVVDCNLYMDVRRNGKKRWMLSMYIMLYNVMSV